MELAEHFAQQACFVSLRPAGAQQVQVQLIEVNADSKATPQPYRLSDTWSAVFHIEHQKQELLTLLRTLPVAHVHYHHLLGHDAWAWELPALLDVDYDFTTHDFYSFCTNITMTGRHGRYEVDAQGECCGGQHPAPIPPVEEEISAWRARNQTLLEGARFVLAPSLDVAGRMHDFASNASIRFAPHTDVDATQLPEPQPRRLAANQPLRIAVIGALSVIKGADILEKAAVLAKQQGLPIEFHLIGFAYRHLQTEPASALRVHGQYDEQELPAILQRLAPDLVWLPAQWPETYSYTLSAALQQGLPVAVPDIGAFVERVVDRDWSWALPWDLSAQEWLSRFVEMRERHFVTGDSPEQLIASDDLLDADDRWGDWNYDEEYLPVTPQPNTDVIEAASLVARELTSSLASRTHAASPAQGRRAQLLEGLVRLRALPVMRPIVKAIPPQFQARVKGWLQR